MLCLCVAAGVVLRKHEAHGARRVERRVLGCGQASAERRHAAGCSRYTGAVPQSRYPSASDVKSEAQPAAKLLLLLLAAACCCCCSSSCNPSVIYNKQRLLLRSSSSSAPAAAVLLLMLAAAPSPPPPHTSLLLLLLRSSSSYGPCTSPLQTMQSFESENYRELEPKYSTGVILVTNCVRACVTDISYGTGNLVVIIIWWGN
jgi:hypothetical protein